MNKFLLSVSELELSVDLSERNGSKPEEITSNECASAPSIPPASYDMSRMASFVCSYAGPTLYRAAAVSDRPASDVCP